MSEAGESNTREYDYYAPIFYSAIKGDKHEQDLRILAASNNRLINAYLTVFEVDSFYELPVEIQKNLHERVRITIEPGAYDE